MRISSLGVLLFLTACGSSPQGSEPEGERIACALDGAVEFTPSCTVERGRDGVTFRHDDGGFRRFALAGDGSVSVADGADPIEATPLADGSIELHVEDDRYRLTLEASASAPNP